MVSTQLENISQLGLFPIYGKIKTAPNHQAISSGLSFQNSFSCSFPCSALVVHLLETGNLNRPDVEVDDLSFTLELRPGSNPSLKELGNCASPYWCFSEFLPLKVQPLVGKKWIGSSRTLKKATFSWNRSSCFPDLLQHDVWRPPWSISTHLLTYCWNSREGRPPHPRHQPSNWCWGFCSCQSRYTKMKRQYNYTCWPVL